MRYFSMLLLFPTWASAQIMPWDATQIAPEQVISSATVEIPLAGIEGRMMVKHAVLVRDEGGWADLYIIHESPSRPTEIIDDILEIQGQLLTVSEFSGSSIDLKLASVEEGNTVEKTWRLAPSWVESGPNHGPFGPYEVTSMAYTITPLGEEDFIYDCEIDFEVGGMRIESKDELIAREEIAVAGPFPHDLGHDDTFDLCHT